MFLDNNLYRSELNYGRNFKIVADKVVSREINLKFGPLGCVELQSRFGDLPDELDRHPHAHPYLRFVTDDLTSKALCLSSKPFTDVGSKYHKISKMWQGKFKAIRAPIFEYDKIYLK